MHCGFNPRARVGRDPALASGGAGCTRFNPRARVGRDHSGGAARADPLMFQSTRPCGARRMTIVSSRNRAMFQSTRPCGARLMLESYMSHSGAVSIHAPVWGATWPGWPALIRGAEFQSTRPCGARRPTNGNAPPGRGVSIHAPVWGATCWAMMQPHRQRVSIHAPVWGATGRGTDRGRRGCRFNPRARVGRDIGRWCRMAGISTCFNPRARVGRDDWYMLVGKRVNSFNPRARVGRDPSGRVWPVVLSTFQSTRPCGARPVGASPVRRESQVSIHAPVWGAT